MRRRAPPHRPNSPTGVQPADKNVGNFGQRKWRLKQQAPAHPPKSSSKSSSGGPKTTVPLSKQRGLRAAACSAETSVSGTELPLWKRRIVPRIVVTDTDACAAMTPRGGNKVLVGNCSADPILAREPCAETCSSQEVFPISPLLSPPKALGGVGEVFLSEPLVPSGPSVALQTADAVVAFSHSCFYFSADVLGRRVTALLDCGASELLSRRVWR